jgi:hypothetical protein
LVPLPFSLLFFLVFGSLTFSLTLTPTTTLTLEAG